MVKDNLESDKYLAICTIESRTSDSRPSSNRENINFEVPKGKNPNSKLEETIKDYLSKPNQRITEIYVNDLYKIAEEIIPKKRNYETHLKQMYDSVD